MVAVTGIGLLEQHCPPMCVQRRITTAPIRLHFSPLKERRSPARMCARPIAVLGQAVAQGRAWYGGLSPVGVEVDRFGRLPSNVPAALRRSNCEKYVWFLVTEYPSGIEIPISVMTVWRPWSSWWRPSWRSWTSW